MGFLRKTLSVGTVGLVDFKSDKERMATSARKTKAAVRNGNREQARLLREQNELLREQNRLLEAGEDLPEDE